MVFKKQKMIDRLKAEGKEEEITVEITAIMNNLDGQTVYTSCWNRVVNDKPVYWCIGKNGEGFDVCESDCE